MEDIQKERLRPFAKNMELDFVRNAVNVSISIIAANAWIRKPIVSIEFNAVFGRCPEIGGRRTSRWGDPYKRKGKERWVTSLE